MSIDLKGALLLPLTVNQEAPVARVAGWTSRTSQDPRFCDLSDRCTLDVHHESYSADVFICRICHVGGFTMWYMH